MKCVRRPVFLPKQLRNGRTAQQDNLLPFPQYFNIVDKISQFTSVRDPVTMTQFAYNNVGFLSYDDERAICDKVGD